jgi:colicin import membrane protein
MDISPGIRDRIFTAADTLYGDAGRQTFPTVDAVRKLAKVNMNDACTGMKAWRRSQSTQVASVAVQVPIALQETANIALVALWSEALAIANETLHSAQTGWDVERAEAEALSEQMANAYEAQAADLVATQAEVTRFQVEIERVNRQMAIMQTRLDDTLRDIAIAETAARHAEIKVTEIERRANDLRNELDRAHALAAEASKELVVIRASYSDEVTSLRTELTRNRQKAESEGVVAQEALSQALEAAAVLRGTLAALTGEKAPVAAKPSSKRKPDGAATKGGKLTP